jgi:triphosphoribosyl-dephospho-CoA synthase
MDGGIGAAGNRLALRPQTGAASASRRRLAGLAVGVLVEEALLTPKPALVDQRGSGAHGDLDLPKMMRSAYALRSCFRSIAVLAWGAPPSPALRETLADVGRRGEAAMRSATGGANAHRGAIWSIGLLVAAAAATRGTCRRAEILTAWIAELVSHPDRYAPSESSHGARACAAHGVRGARGEAAAGFPHIVQRGLPELLECRRRGLDERTSRINTLMAIMSSLDDTCLLHRGGRLALETAQAGAQAVLSTGGISSPTGRARLFELERALMALNASPGGSADLLAGTLLLDALDVQPPGVRCSRRFVRGMP